MNLKGRPIQDGTARSDSATTDQETRAAVRQLVDLALAEDPENDVRGDVLVDVNVDGFRCLISLERPPEEPGRTVTLSPREREVVRMVAAGYPNKTIAAVLDISSWTVSTHLRRVFAKLGVRTRAAMVAQALEAGLISEHETGPLPLF